MAPKEDTAAKPAGDEDPKVTIARDVNLWRFLLRYHQAMDIPLNVGNIKKVGNVPHSSAYTLLNKAKKLEGIEDVATPKKGGAPSTPKSGAKKSAIKKRDTEDGDGNGDAVDESSPTKKSAKSKGVKAQPKMKSEEDEHMSDLHSDEDTPRKKPAKGKVLTRPSKAKPMKHEDEDDEEVAGVFKEEDSVGSP